MEETRTTVSVDGEVSPRHARVAIVVPTWSGEVRRLRQSIERQTFRDYTVHVVTRVRPAARAQPGRRRDQQ